MAMSKKDNENFEEVQEEESDDEDIPPCCCSSSSIDEGKKMSLASKIKRAFGFGRRKRMSGSMSLGKDSDDDDRSSDDDWPPIKKTGPYNNDTIVAPVARSTKKTNRVIIGRAAPTFRSSTTKGFSRADPKSTNRARTSKTGKPSSSCLKTKTPQHNRVRVTIEHVRIVPDHMHSETVLSDMRQDGVTVTKSQLMMDTPWVSALNAKHSGKMSENIEN